MIRWAILTGIWTEFDNVLTATKLELSIRGVVRNFRLTWVRACLLVWKNGPIQNDARPRAPEDMVVLDLDLI